MSIIGMTPREVQHLTDSAVGFTSLQQSVLVGTMLGDASLAKHGDYHRLFVKHKEGHRSLAEWKREIFRDFTTMPLHFFEQRLNGRGYPCVQFVTRTSPIFSVWHERFYRAKRKVVPTEIADLLTPVAVAVWLMDDGTADRAGISFQTHAFTIDEVRGLGSALYRLFGLRTSAIRNGGAWILYVYGSSVPALRALVEPYVLTDLRYKLNPRGSWTP
jgi:ubiquinol-cytochrome c reductase cytochrome b subunit